MMLMWQHLCILEGESLLRGFFWLLGLSTLRGLREMQQKCEDEWRRSVCLDLQMPSKKVPSVGTC